MPSAPGAARLRSGDFEAEAKGFMKVLLPLLMPMIKRDIAKQHVHFKNLCETQAG